MIYVKEHSDKPVQFLSIYIGRGATYEAYLEAVKKELCNVINLQHYPGVLWMDAETFSMAKEVADSLPFGSRIMVNEYKKYEVRNAKGNLVCNYCGHDEIDDDGPVWHCKKCREMATMIPLRKRNA